MKNQKNLPWALICVGISAFEFEAIASDATAPEFACTTKQPYAQRTVLPMPSLSNMQLQGEKDATYATPEAKTNYLEEDDSSGHSRLGLRFLARMFGYDGPFKDGTEVDAWIAQKDISDPRMRGIAKVWQKWKNTSPLLLTVVNYDTTKNIYQPDRLFHSPQEEAEFAKCVATDIAELKCANTTGYDMKEGYAYVYYSQDPASATFCEVRFPGNSPKNAPAVQADTGLKNAFALNGSAGANKSGIGKNSILGGK